MMTLDANFIISIAKLAIEMGDNIISPSVNNFHADKSSAQKDKAVTSIKSIIEIAKSVNLPTLKDNKL